MDDVPGMIRPDLQALPQVRDRMTFLYLEHCTLGRQDGAITVTEGYRSDPGGRHFGAAARPRHPCDPPCHGADGRYRRGRGLGRLFPAYAGVIPATPTSAA